MSKKYILVSGAIFGVVAVVHAVRIFDRWPVQIASHDIPVWVSWIAVIGGGALCLWALRAWRR